jgi:hypothetical protein
MSKFIDLTRQKFGRLEVLKRVENNKQNKPQWLCQCNCGNKSIVSGGNLKNGSVRSCGCLQKEKVIINNINKTIHSHCRNRKSTGFYNSWHQIIQRCTNPNNEAYHNYGGRGIIVCKRWLKFENFLKDMIKRWKPGLQIERRNNNKGYYKKNCKWATRKQQARNRRDNLYVSYNGENRLFVELYEEHNMPRKIVHNRFYNYGWTIRRALTTPVKKRSK